MPRKIADRCATKSYFYLHPVAPCPQRMSDSVRWGEKTIWRWFRRHRKEDREPDILRLVGCCRFGTQSVTDGRGMCKPVHRFSGIRYRVGLRRCHVWPRDVTTTSGDVTTSRPPWNNVHHDNRIYYYYYYHHHHHYHYKIRMLWKWRTVRKTSTALKRNRTCHMVVNQSRSTDSNSDEMASGCKQWLN